MPQPVNGQLPPVGLGPIRTATPSQPVGQTSPAGGAFAAQLAVAREAVAPGRELRFSAHAQQRLASRNIHLDDASLQRLAQATDQAQAKGARDSLFLMNDLGLIVNVPSRTVVTAMDGERLNGGIFTNIDSTVIIRDH